MKLKRIGLIAIVAVVVAAIAVIVIVNPPKDTVNTDGKSSSATAAKAKEKDTENKAKDSSLQNKEGTSEDEGNITNPNNGKLIVNGKDITNECYVNFYKPVLKDDVAAYYKEMNYSTDFPMTVAIPMGAVTKELGATVTWQGNSMIIRYKEWETELSKDLPHLGVPVVPSNCVGVRQIVNDDFIVDIHSLLTFLKNMDAQVKIDRDNMIVYIDNR